MSRDLSEATLKLVIKQAPLFRPGHPLGRRPAGFGVAFMNLVGAEDGAKGHVSPFAILVTYWFSSGPRVLYYNVRTIQCTAMSKNREFLDLKKGIQC